MSPAAQPIQLLTFDLDDTLWDLAPVLAIAETEAWEWLRRQVPALAVDWDMARLRELRLELMRTTPATAHRVTQMRRDSVTLALQRCGVATAAAEQIAADALEVFVAARHRITLFDQVEEVLQQLAARYRLAAITNGNACVYRLGLGGYFDFAIQAETLPRAKPHPDPFEAALAQAGCLPAAAIHIGDHCDHDICAAQAVGMGTIWLNRHGLPWPGGTPPLAEIATIGELPAAVAAIDVAASKD